MQKEETGKMPPILKYPGAKWRIADWIIKHMPPHESYLEPFFGSGAVLFNKEPSRIETINDLDGAVVHFFRVCREQPEELARAVALTPWARDEYLLAEFRDDGNVGDVERARQFLVRSWMAFGSCLDRKTGWRHTTASAQNGGPDNPKLWKRLPEQIMQIANRLSEVQIENKPAIDVIRRFSGTEVLIYADPPYVLATRSAHKDQYRHEMSDRDHLDLLEALKAHQGMAMISGYACDLYCSALSGWRLFQRAAVAERGARRTECLWLNDVAYQRCEQGIGQLNMFSMTAEQRSERC